jgi:hypothetical protein
LECTPAFYARLRWFYKWLIIPPPPRISWNGENFDQYFFSSGFDILDMCAGKLTFVPDEQPCQVCEDGDGGRTHIGTSINFYFVPTIFTQLGNYMQFKWMLCMCQGLSLVKGPLSDSSRSLFCFWFYKGNQISIMITF